MEVAGIAGTEVVVSQKKFHITNSSRFMLYGCCLGIAGSEPLGASPIDSFYVIHSLWLIY